MNQLDLKDLATPLVELRPDGMLVWRERPPAYFEPLPCATNRTPEARSAAFNLSKAGKPLMPLVRNRAWSVKLDGRTVGWWALRVALGPRLDAGSCPNVLYSQAVRAARPAKRPGEVRR